ncbi:DUF6415 family natural product biosynthesis protein [Streptomyces scopuliridis]|uniref:DUF6415 family natural product biosynthesis protein n=1 Tax=Streptomyces scopuliridis TaxID=452529 RepID=UPI0036CA3A74
MKPPQSARSSPANDLSPIDVHAIAIDVDSVLAPHQIALPPAVVAARTERLRAHLALLVPHVENTPSDARGLFVNRALREARELVAKSLPAEEQFASWVHMRALARVTALLCGHSRQRTTNVKESALPAPYGGEGAVSQWLASSIDTPDFAFEDWQSGRPAVLRCGVRFDAVRMPVQLVHGAAGSTAPEVVGGFLAEMLDGAVICHPGQWYYALVPPGTAEVWRSPWAVVRSIGAWLGVPRPDRTEPSGVSLYWSLPMAEAGTLCSADAVAELLRLGHARLEGAAP